MSDPSARFERIYGDNLRPVLGYALRRCDIAADAMDVTAEVFVVAWRRLDDVPDGEAQRPWLLATARKVLANHRRGERRRGVLADRLHTEIGAVVARGPHDAVVAREDVRRVRVALATLPPVDRELITLTAWEGLTPAQAATVVGLAAPAARVRLHRARRRLAAALQRDEPAGQHHPDGQLRTETSSVPIEGAVR